MVKVSPWEELPLSLSVSERRHAILQHVFRYRLTTRPILREQFWFLRDKSKEAFKLYMKRFAAPWHSNWTPEDLDKKRKDFYLCAEPIKLKKLGRYYRLTPRGVRKVGVTDRYERFAKAHDAASLFPRFAYLEFCCGQQAVSSGARWNLLTYWEIKEHFPMLEALAKRAFALDPKNGNLTRLLVDTGGDRRRLVVKALATIDTLEQFSSLCKLRDGGHFNITILTGYPNAMSDLQSRIQQANPSFPVEIVVIPALAELLESHD